MQHLLRQHPHGKNVKFFVPMRRCSKGIIVQLARLQLYFYVTHIKFIRQYYTNTIIIISSLFLYYYLFSFEKLRSIHISRSLKMTIVSKSTGKHPMSRSGKSNDSECSTSANKKRSMKRKSASLPSKTVDYLKRWMMSPEHIAHPYPTEQEKVEIMKDTGIELKQLTNWFVNNRKRYWKPRVEARLQHQAQAAQAVVQAHAAAVVAVSVACGGIQQQQQVSKLSDISAKAATTRSSAANLVSPNANSFNSIKAPLSTRRTGDGIVDTSIDNGIATTAVLSSLRREPFASPLTYAAQMIEQIKDESVVVSTATSSFSTAVSSQAPVCVASVSASEGEMSDSGTDDSSSLSSDSTNPMPGSKKSIKNEPITSHISYPNDEESSKTMKTRSVSFSSLELFSTDILSSQEIETNSKSINCTSFPSSFIDNNSKKRALIVNNNEEGISTGLQCTTRSCTNPSPPPLKRFRTVSVDVWIDACRNASHINDERLPSMEEASRLFGYTNY